MMRDVLPHRNLSTNLFGRTLPAPVVMAPVGVQTLFHPTGERATAKVFGELGLPYTLSTATSTGFADVAEANGDGSPRWYQLYWPSDDDLTRSYLRSAKENGYEVLVVTVDTWDLGWRTRDLDRGFFPFIRGIGVQIGLEDSCAHEKLGFNPLAPNATAEQKQTAALYHVITTSRGISPVWRNLTKLREFWGDGPIVLKGIQTAEDAQMAVEYGIDGIILSNVSFFDNIICFIDNHEARRATSRRCNRLSRSSSFHCGGCKGEDNHRIRRRHSLRSRHVSLARKTLVRANMHRYKAIALGADFVQLGRPVLWGLAHEGEKGVRHVLKSLLAEFDLTVGLSGCETLDQVNSTFLQRVE